MADATRYAKLVAGGLLKASRFTAASDNDVLLSGDEFLVMGFYNHGSVTALNIDAGADITAFPVAVAADETLCVTGTGDVTVVYALVPETGFDTLDT